MYFLRESVFLILIFTLCALIKCEDVEGEQDGSIRYVEIESGKLSGQRNFTLFEQMPFYEFKGIPYAQPPINHLRFRVPKKPMPWNGTFEAFEFGNQCLQKHSGNGKIVGDEDCLYLNVYVPDQVSSNDENTKYPVMIYIHGGAYQTGSGNPYGPDFLLEQNVIVVTLNYRLGPFGFLSINHPDYSGNMGLKDQRMAIKWVNRNIEKFGGDKTQITIFGHGAGGSSVHFHTISPSMKNLFKRAIISSGSALLGWSYTDFNQQSFLYNIATMLFYPVDNNNDLIAMLKQVDGKVLLEFVPQITEVSGLGRHVTEFIWSPLVEHPRSVEPYLTVTPMDKLNEVHFKSNVDTMFGYTEMESYRFLVNEFRNPELLKMIDKQFEMEFPLQHTKLKFHTRQYSEIATEMRNYYFDDKHIDNRTLHEFSQMMSDIWFNYGIDLSARIHSNKSDGDTFFYKFSVVGDLNFILKRTPAEMLGMNGSTHGDDVFYLFRMDTSDFEPESTYDQIIENSLERKTILFMNKLWTNFAKYGNPIPNTDETIVFNPNDTINQYNYIDITNDGLVVKINLNAERMNFWSKILNEYDHYWQRKEFSLNSLAVKVPLAILTSLLLSILCCKGIAACWNRRQKTNNK